MNAKEGKIGFIGAGNMATAMVKGLIRSNLYAPDQLSASDAEESKIETISKAFGLKGSANNQELVRDCDIVVLSVKPQVIHEVLEEIKGVIRDDHLVISIAAGIPIKLIQAFLGPNIPIIRVMPNTPALIQKGISALAPGESTSSAHIDKARVIFDAVGETVIVQENMMDAVTALSGSGPGFLFRIMECFVEGGQQLGFDEEISRRLVIQTFLGATQLAGESEKSLSELREMVTSPGGTTAAGLDVFAEKDLKGLIQDVLKAAHKRGVELGRNLGDSS